MATTPKAVRKQELADALEDLAQRWDLESQEEEIETNAGYFANVFAGRLRDVVAKHS